jgi:concanavalin A-like lectin/glucanase superfamily protein
VTLFGPGFLAGQNGNDSFTKIMLHMEGSNGGTVFTDDNFSGARHAWTAHSATTSTSAAKFGTTGLDCGAGAGYIDTPDSADYTLGANDFTVDCWFNVQGGGGASRYLFGQMDSGGTVWSIVGLLAPANTLSFRIQTGSSLALIGSTAIASAGWHHFAGVRSGGSLKMFLDGALESSAAISGSVVDSADTFAVGRGGASAGSQWNGFMDEFRLSVGIARWTANFTPPSLPYS